MKRFLICLVALCLAPIAHAQVTIQQNATHLDAATAVAFNQAAVASASTCTITVPSGQYAYITGIGIDLAQNATGTTAVTNQNTVAMTNIVGGPQWTFSCTGAGANNNCVGVRENFSIPLKSAAPGTNVSLATAAPGATAQYTCRVYYYLAP